MSSDSCIEVGSVSRFLEAVKKIYCDKDHQLFYRGVSQTKYATPEHDHPGIYRNKNWIDNEDKMFYELTSKCPEYFKDCKTTFEHLVMMQHYGYPTRLLDITSNPLVALYFACGGLNGSNLEDGQLISYHIKKNDIRNYDAIYLKIITVIAKLKSDLQFALFDLYSQVGKFNSIYLDAAEVQITLKKFELMKTMFLNTIIPNITQALCILDQKYFIETHFVLNEINEFKKVNSLENVPDEQILMYFKLIMSNLSDELKIYKENVFSNYMAELKREDSTFDTVNITKHHLTDIQCVLPKQNNPRLIAQQGAFLLFGFKDAVSDKTATPIVPNEMYGRAKASDNKNSGQKAEIIIKGSEKQKILDELKILGISNSTMFPEIDNIANELKNQYTNSIF